MTIKGTFSEFLARFGTTPLGDRLYHYAVLVRLNRPIGIYLLLWPCLWALWAAAEGVPDVGVLVVFVLGTVLMRSAGCAINDYADRDIDGRVARTTARPLATGAVTPREALAVFAALCVVAFVLVLTMNRLTIYLSFGGLVLAAIYPFAKRYTYLPQIVLGAAFGWAIPMAWAAQTGGIDRLAWLIYIIAILWALAYDTMYAMADRDDDVQLGVKSTAILFGDADIPIVAVIQAIVMAGLLLMGGQLALGAWYYTAWVLACALAAYQIFLIGDRHPVHCVRAFLNNHYLGLIIFIGMVCDYAFR